MTDKEIEKFLNKYCIVCEDRDNLKKKVEELNNTILLKKILIEYYENGLAAKHLMLNQISATSKRLEIMTYLFILILIFELIMRFIK